MERKSGRSRATCAKNQRMNLNTNEILVSTTAYLEMAFKMTEQKRLKRGVLREGARVEEASERAS